MNPIVCRKITQAWKVKKAYEPLGWRVRIEKRPPNGNGKICWVCQFYKNENFNLPWHKKLVNLVQRLCAQPPRGEIHGKSRTKATRR